MAVSSILQIPLLSTNQSSKEVTINDMVGALEKSWNSGQTVDFTSGDVTMPILDLLRFFYFKSANVAAAQDLNIPNATRLFVFSNADSTFNVTIRTESDFVVVPAGATLLIGQTGATLIMLANSETAGAFVFTDLSDTPSTFGTSGQLLQVNGTQDALEWVDPVDLAVETFLELPDVPDTWGTEGQALRIDSTGAAFEWYTPVSSFFDLSNVDDDTFAEGSAGWLVAVNAEEDGLTFIDPSILSSFTGLSDTPGTYVGQAGRVPVVNEEEDALEFQTLQEIAAVPLGSLTDVELTSIANGQFLKYDTATETWVNVTLNLSVIADVDLSTPATNGQVLSWSTADSAWVPKSVSGVTDTLNVNTQTASYSLVIGDAEGYVRMNVATANNLTVPSNASVEFPVGTTIAVRQAGAGQTTIVAASGVTISTAETLKLRKQHSGATLIKVGTDAWDLVGDLELSE